MVAAARGQVSGTPRVILRLEGFMLGALCIWLFAGTGASWWLFAALILAPDLGMLLYLANPRLGATLYNATHSLIGPALLAIANLSLALPMALAIALIWAGHIAFDRGLGYGLKYPSLFADTHLGVLGPPRKAG
ncbi:DUF4260 domain-containing protein [Bosea sp. LC85]|uniref:DUF4260 domain-containing protein n=1 Tax=Bosea sp. LC85 TaxID=1502851 RepID=UPI0005B7C566|nr:DUF4260 domain-containing protein [Bosea sp. LC85]